MMKGRDERIAFLRSSCRRDEVNLIHSIYTGEITINNKIPGSVHPALKK
jgi:hypothetical protein